MPSTENKLPKPCPSEESWGWHMLIYWEKLIVCITQYYVSFKTMKKCFVSLNLKLIFLDTLFSYSAVSFVKIINATLLII